MLVDYPLIVWCNTSYLTVSSHWGVGYRQEFYSSLIAKTRRIQIREPFSPNRTSLNNSIDFDFRFCFFLELVCLGGGTYVYGMVIFRDMKWRGTQVCLYGIFTRAFLFMISKFINFKCKKQQRRFSKKNRWDD